MYDDGYKKGLSGQSVFSTNDVLGWAAGDTARKMNDTSSAIQGEEHPHAFQIFILMGIAGWVIAAASELGWNPFGYLGSFVSWAVISFLLYKIFCLLPGWLGGGVMGLSLGGGAAYLSWLWSNGDLYWTCGAGLGVGVIIYFMFSWLE